MTLRSTPVLVALVVMLSAVAALGAAPMTLISTLQNKSPFLLPAGVAVNSKGVMYVADSGHNRIVVMTPEGAITANLTVSSPAFSHPYGVALSSTSPAIFVADTGNNRIVQLTSAGLQGTVTTGFNAPSDVAVDSSNNLYVADSGNNRVVYVPHAAHEASQDLVDPTQAFSGPDGVAVDAKGNIYVADTGNGRIVVFNSSFSVTGRFTNGHLLNKPNGVAVDAVGNMYIADYGNRQIVVLSKTGGFISSNKTGIDLPSGIAYFDGAVYVADSGNQQVVELNESKTPGTLIATYLEEFSKPSAVAFDSKGQMYLTDSGNNRIVVLSPNGTQVNVFGHIKNPWGIALDSLDRLYVVSNGDNAVYQLSSKTGAIVRTYTVNGGAFDSPSYIAVNTNGTRIYVSDTSAGRIVMLNQRGTTASLITPSGVPYPLGIAVDSHGLLYVTNDCTVGGACGVVSVLSSGGAVKHQFVAPYGSGSGIFRGVAVDAAFRIYTTDEDNNRVVVLSRTGSVLYSIVQSGAHSLEGIGVSPLTGNVYVVDYYYATGAMYEYQGL